ncbi:MAG TPA: hypothetical protein VMH81_08940 [Bryobacteraceae bacterium]|nr:hypothetical protein [Bryobacteraceae bacterium]
MKPKILAGVFVLFGTMWSACAGGGAYYVRYAPPAPRYAVVGVAPGPGYVWTTGYWDWRGGNWAWVEGRWQRPPRARAAWVAPEWRHEGRGYRFHRGYWR